MLIRDDIVRRLESDRLATIIMLSAGAEGLTVPDVETELARFDAALAEPPKIPGRADAARRALRTALGLAAEPERNTA